MSGYRILVSTCCTGHLLQKWLKQRRLNPQNSELLSVPVEVENVQVLRHQPLLNRQIEKMRSYPHFQRHRVELKIASGLIPRSIRSARKAPQRSGRDMCLHTACTIAAVCRFPLWSELLQRLMKALEALGNLVVAKQHLL
jgi:hypothetical protein